MCTVQELHVKPNVTIGGSKYHFKFSIIKLPFVLQHIFKSLQSSHQDH